MYTTIVFMFRVDFMVDISTRDSTVLLEQENLSKYQYRKRFCTGFTGPRVLCLSMFLL